MVWGELEPDEEGKAVGLLFSHSPHALADLVRHSLVPQNLKRRRRKSPTRKTRKSSGPETDYKHRLVSTLHPVLLRSPRQYLVGLKHPTFWTFENDEKVPMSMRDRNHFIPSFPKGRLGCGASWVATGLTMCQAYLVRHPLHYLS